VLDQQKTQIGSWGVRGGDRQQHKTIVAGAASEYLSLETAKPDGNGPVGAEINHNGADRV
jgi:hypothetical protein